CQQHNRYPPTF
nr:immunoglobulin light chain junction region [Macaca mulatta]MOW43284.1 immunoglobulin light chain junction region [Macaca mulatta]MOW43512.1 immunoglobulin light chain junction region [Macaca mulatta]MOW43563.1 immunoglobulin light chain junction region [Macaca mulatta]MOW43622.1 immunoglobulin light chain junction region [Macaca mulatta]